MSIEEEILRSNAYPNVQSQLQVNILYTAAWINKQSNQLLKPFDITLQQYNILRILRGCNGHPATVKLLTSRMFDKMSNASRLVDKLVRKNLAERKRSTVDRREVEIIITPKGIKLVGEAERSLAISGQKYLASISDQEASTVNDLLNRLRASY